MESINLETEQSPKKALIVLLLQNDYIDIEYCGNKKLNNIISLINKYKKKFDQVIFIKDWFSNDHVTYKNAHIKLCVSNTHGAELSNLLKINNKDYIIHINTLNLYTSDSAFYNAKSSNIESPLKNILDENKIKQIYLCGINLECQIFLTAYDAKILGYECFIVEDLTCGKDNKKIERSLNFLKQLGINIVSQEKYI